MLEEIFDRVIKDVKNEVSLVVSAFQADLKERNGIVSVKDLLKPQSKDFKHDVRSGMNITEKLFHQ